MKNPNRLRILPDAEHTSPIDVFSKAWDRYQAAISQQSEDEFDAYDNLIHAAFRLARIPVQYSHDSFIKVTDWAAGSIDVMYGDQDPDSLDYGYCSLDLSGAVTHWSRPQSEPPDQRSLFRVIRNEDMRASFTTTDYSPKDSLFIVKPDA